jgi:hypothetical protein
MCLLRAASPPAYGAIGFHTARGKKATINPVVQGLPVQRQCPTGAVFLKRYTSDEVFGQIEAALAG